MVLRITLGHNAINGVVGKRSDQVFGVMDEETGSTCAIFSSISVDRDAFIEPLSVVWSGIL